MGLYENVKEAAKRKGYSINRLEQELGFARSYIAKLKRSHLVLTKFNVLPTFSEYPLNICLQAQKRNPPVTI